MDIFSFLGYFDSSLLILKGREKMVKAPQAKVKAPQAKVAVMDQLVMDMKRAIQKVGLEFSEETLKEIIRARGGETCETCASVGCRDGCNAGCLSACKTGNK